MKALKLTLLTYFLFSNNLFSQFKPIHSFEPGYIIRKNNDTIYCAIQLDQVDQSDIAPLCEPYVNYKTENNDKVQSIKIKEVRTVKAGIRIFQNIMVDKSELLFKVVVSGQASLLQYPKISIILGRTGSGMISRFGPPDIRYYAIKTDKETFIIKQKKDVKSLIQIFESCPEVKAMIEGNSFKLEDLKAVVTNFNNCK